MILILFFRCVTVKTSNTLNDVCQVVLLFLLRTVALLLCCCVPLFVPPFVCYPVALFLCAYCFCFLKYTFNDVSQVVLHEPWAKMLWTQETQPQQILTAVMTHIAVDKSVLETTLHQDGLTLSHIRFVYHNINVKKKIFRFFKAWPLAWHIELKQRCLDSYRQRQISQPDSKTCSKLPGLTYREPIPPPPHPIPSAS